MRTDNLGDCMKMYEHIPSYKLMRRTPVIIRLDGKAFHTYTKGAQKPFDPLLYECRKYVVENLMDNIQGALIAYAQSDEISILLKDWTTFNSDAWFGNKIQKLCSVSASMCTGYWNAFMWNRNTPSNSFTNRYAFFDSRCFNVPKEEVINYFIWRQQDWVRNSIQMLGRAHFSHNELNKVSSKGIVTKLEEEKGVIWGNLPVDLKQGVTYIKGQGFVEVDYKEHRQVLEHDIYKTED